MLEHCKLRVEKLVLVQPAGFSFHSERPSSSRCRQIVADTRKIDRDETGTFGGNVCDRLLAVSNALPTVSFLLFVPPFPPFAKTGLASNESIDFQIEIP